MSTLHGSACMNKLVKFSTPPKNLLPSQLLFLKKACEKKGCRFVFVHKFLFLIECNNEKFYVKINLMDNEFYLFSKKQSMLFFYSFDELNKWISTQLFRGDGEG